MVLVLQPLNPKPFKLSLAASLYIYNDKLTQPWINLTVLPSSYVGKLNLSKAVLPLYIASIRYRYYY